MSLELLSHCSAWVTCFTARSRATVIRAAGVWAVICATGRSATSQTAFRHPLQDQAVAVSYDHYRPGECLAAVARERQHAMRTQASAPDMWRQQLLETDTVLAVERTTARTCIAHLTTTAVPPQELTNLVRLAWFAGDTSRMRGALERRRQLDSTDAQRAATGQQLVTRFLMSSPRDVAFATEAVLPSLASVHGPEALAARMLAHVSLANIYTGSSRAPDAPARGQANIDSAVALYERMPSDMKAAEVDTIGPIFKLGAAEATQRGDTARTHVLLAAARHALAKVPDGSDYVHDAEAVIRYFGILAPPIHANFLYETREGQTPPPREPGDTTGTHLVHGVVPSGAWPRPGHWTLVSPMPMGSYDAGFYRNVRKIAGDSLDIVFVAATRGFWPPLGPFSPEREGAIMYDYLSRHWNLPGVLLVEDRPFHKLPDGRRINDGTVTKGLYFNTNLLIDPSGTIRAMLTQSSMVRFDQILTDLMQRFHAHQGH